MNIRSLQLDFLHAFLRELFPEIEHHVVESLLGEILALSERGRKVEAIGLLRKQGQNKVVSTTTLDLCEGRLSSVRRAVMELHPYSSMKEVGPACGGGTLIEWATMCRMTLAEAKAVVDIITSMTEVPVTD